MSISKISPSVSSRHESRQKYLKSILDSDEEETMVTLQRHESVRISKRMLAKSAVDNSKNQDYARNKYTNIFIRKTFEQAYDDWSLSQYFNNGCNAMIVVICLHFILAFLDAFIFKKKIRRSSAIEVIQWLYLLIALPLVCSKYRTIGFLKKLRENWKSLFAASISALFFSSFMKAGFLANETKDAFLHHVSQIFNETCPVSSSSKHFYNREFLNEFSPWLKKTLGALLLASATLLIIIAQALISAVQGGFPQVMCCTLIMIISISINLVYWEMNADVQACFFAVISVLLVLFLAHDMDKAERIQFSSHHRAECRTDILENKLNKVKELVIFEDFRTEEKVAVEKVFDQGELADQLQKYRIPLEDLVLEKIVGQGTYGEVIRCVYFGTTVILKRMHRSKITQESMEEFGNEIILMSDLRHPNIVQFIGASWNTYSNIGFVLEFVDHGDLYVIIHERRKSKSWSDPFHRIAVDSARGISYLHGRNILHRDLKSMNILVSETYCAKICDFGLSKSSEKIKENEKQVGTPLWTAPEVFLEAKFTPKSDVFAFGIILTELLTRKIPYHEYTKDMSAYKVMLSVATENLRPTLPDWLPREVLNLVNSCLDQNPDKRPTMKEIIVALNSSSIVEFDAEKTWQKVRGLVEEKVHKHGQLTMEMIRSAKEQAKLEKTNSKDDRPNKILTLDDNINGDEDDMSAEDVDELEDW